MGNCIRTKFNDSFSDNNLEFFEKVKVHYILVANPNVQTQLISIKTQESQETKIIGSYFTNDSFTENYGTTKTGTTIDGRIYPADCIVLVPRYGLIEFVTSNVGVGMVSEMDFLKFSASTILNVTTNPTFDVPVTFFNEFIALTRLNIITHFAGNIEDLAVGQVQNGRTSGTLLIINNSQGLRYQGNTFGRAEIAFDSSVSGGYTITITQ